MDLANLIESRLDLPRLQKDLDDLGPEGRLWAVGQWRRATMARLWEAVQGKRPLSLDDIVPPPVDPLVEVIYDGRNTLFAFQTFQKRFCRPDATRAEGGPVGPADPILFGYNHQPMMPLTGPGYFIVRPSPQTEGELEIDHAELPISKASHWPALRPNSSGVGWLVYDSRVDVVRGVSSEVCIGRGKKGPRWLDQWFVLVRRPLSAAQPPVS